MDITRNIYSFMTSNASPRIGLTLISCPLVYVKTGCCSAGVTGVNPARL